MYDKHGNSNTPDKDALYGLDKIVGSAPWGMIAGLLFGFCAGVMNVVRALLVMAY